MTYTPASVVVAFDSTLVSTLVAITVAPTSTPPAESVTVPLNCDRATCACATPPPTRHAATTTVRQPLIDMCSPPPSGVGTSFVTALSTRNATVESHGSPRPSRARWCLTQEQVLMGF